MSHQQSVFHPTEIGWREHVGLPDLHIPTIRAKIDTGARTSALHASVNRQFELNGQIFVEFLAPIPGSKKQRTCSAPLIDIRDVKNTSGIPESRHFIATTLVIGRRHWRIEVTLTDRENMKFDLILGRTAIREHRMSVNPGRSFLAGSPCSLVKTL